MRAYAHARMVGENLAFVSGSRGLAHRVLTMWLRSPPHRSVLLSSRYRRIGVATLTGQLGAQRATVITADFASRR